MLQDQKFQLLIDFLSVFILTVVLTKADILTMIRIKIDGSYQRVMRSIGHITTFSPSTCHLCVSLWVSLLYQPEFLLPTYALSYILSAFLKYYEIHK